MTEKKIHLLLGLAANLVYTRFGRTLTKGQKNAIVCDLMDKLNIPLLEEIGGSRTVGTLAIPHKPKKESA